MANVKDFGATGDGSTDDTADIQDALDQCHLTGEPLYFPPGTYKVIGSGSEIFLVERTIHIYGDGIASSIRPDAPTTRDVFVFDPDVADGSFFRVRDLYINPFGTEENGQHGIRIRPSTVQARHWSIERVLVRRLAGFAVYLDAATEQIFFGTIRECRLLGNGIKATNVLDSIRIANNILAGDGGTPLDLNFGGGGNAVITENSVSATGGSLITGNMAAMQVRGNYFETQGPSAVDSMLDLQGDYDNGMGTQTATLTMPIVRENIFTAKSNSGLLSCINLGRCSRPLVSDNFFSLQESGCEAVTIQDECTEPRIVDYVTSTDGWRKRGVTELLATNENTGSSGTGLEIELFRLDVRREDIAPGPIRIKMTGTIGSASGGRFLRLKADNSILHSWSTSSPSRGYSWEVLLWPDRLVSIRAIDNLPTITAEVNVTQNLTDGFELEVTGQGPAPGDPSGDSFTVEQL